MFEQEEIERYKKVLRMSEEDVILYLENAIRDIFFPPTEESSQELASV